jgi:hypothetical protein
MPSRWDHLFEQKPVALMDHLAEEVSTLLATDLKKWPLPLVEIDLEAGKAFTPWALGEEPRPSPVVFHEGFKLARWDLCHETEAYDDYFRNQRWAELGLTAHDKPALMFLGRWLLDQLTALREATQNRVNRSGLLRILERTEKKWAQDAH